MTLRWVRSPRGRVTVLAAVYFVALAWAFVARVGGSERARLVEYVLVGAGLVLIAVAGVPRRPVPLRVAGCFAAVFGPSVVMFMALLVGLGVWLGVLAGLGAGLLVVGALLWLRGVAAIVRNPRIMLTHRGSSATVGRLRAALQGAYGARNVDDVGPARLTPSELRERLQDRDALFVVIGPSWLGGLDQADDEVRHHVEGALAADVPVVPLLVDGASVPKAEHLPESLRPLPAMHGYAIASGAGQDASVRDAVERSRDVVAPGQPLSRRSVTRRRIVVAALAAVVLLPVAWEGVELWTDPVRGRAAAAVAPDGRSVVTVHVIGGRTIVHRWNPETGAVEASRVVPGWAEPLWSPDGRTIAVGGPDETLRLHDAQTLAPVRVVPAVGSVLGWSADGTWLVTTTRRRTLHVVRADTGERVASTAPLGPAGFAAADWSAATSRLALSTGSTIAVLGVGVGGFGPPTALVNRTDVRHLRWSPDGAALAVGAYGPGGSQRVVSIFDGAGARRDLPQDLAEDGFRFSPDGASLATVDLWGAVRVFDVATGALRSEVKSPALLLHSSRPGIAWSPDGEAVAVGSDGFARVVGRAGPVDRPVPGEELMVLGWPAPDRVVVSAYGDDRIDVLDPGTGDVTTCRLLTWDLLLGWAAAPD